MSEEKMKILEMIEKKVITPSEGLELLNVIDEKAVVMSEAPEMKETSDLEELETNLNEKVEQIKEKAKEIKDKIKVDADFNGYKAKLDVDLEDFKGEMKSLGANLKKEMKSLKKDAKNIGKGISTIDTSFIKDIINDAVESVKTSEFINYTDNINEEDYEMDEDKNVRNYNITQEFSIDCDGKKDIAIDVISTDVNIVTEEREDILVKYINYSESDENSFKVIVAEDSKTVKIAERKEKGKNSFMNFNFSSGGKELLIRMPRKYKESLSVKTISGDLNINYLDSDSFRFSSISGDINADIIYSVNSLIKSTSGDCEISLFRGNMMFSSVSGDINVKYEKLDGDFTMKSVSGDAELELPKNSEFEMIGKTVSGDLDCEFPLTIIGTVKRGKLRGQVGSDEYTISASTTSGDVNISRY